MKNPGTPLIAVVALQGIRFELITAFEAIVDKLLIALITDSIIVIAEKENGRFQAICVNQVLP